MSYKKGESFSFLLITFILSIGLPYQKVYGQDAAVLSPFLSTTILSGTKNAQVSDISSNETKQKYGLSWEADTMSFSYFWR